MDEPALRPIAKSGRDTADSCEVDTVGGRPVQSRPISRRMCNLDSITKGQAEIREFTGDARHHRQLAVAAGVFPDYPAPVVRTASNGRVLTMMRWGMPSPQFVLMGRKTDSGVTNVRNVKSPHWGRWLAPAHRCVVPFTSFSEYEIGEGGKKVPVWYALDETWPLVAFAGIWTNWTSSLKIKEGELTADLYAFLTCEPDVEVGAVHPKTMPGILTEPDEIDVWIRGVARGGGVAAAAAERGTADCCEGRAEGRGGPQTIESD